MKMMTTTAGRTNEEMIEKAKQIALDLGVPYVERRKRSLSVLMEGEGSACIVVGKKRLELFPYGEVEPFFFHPNSAMFRIKRLLKKEKDPFVEATKLDAGMSLLDCTLGLASDSIVASFKVGPLGRIIGVEANPYLAYIVRDGLNAWSSGVEGMNEAMRRIAIVQKNSLEFMQGLEDNSIDCVYFDPMFEENILESDGIKGLAHFACREDLSECMMHHALRIARQRVVLKDHYRSPRFNKVGFSVHVRKTAKFHYGVIEKT